MWSLSKMAMELALGLLQRVVEVAGLGVVVVGAGDVADAALGGELAELVTPAIVEQIDPHLVVRPVHGDGAEHRRADDGHRLVIGGDVDVHGGPEGDVLRHGNRLALERPERLHIAQDEHENGIHLGEGEADAECQFGDAAEIERLGDAPDDVAQRDGEAEHHEEDRDGAAFEPVGDEEDDGGGDGQDRLLARVQLHGRDRDQQRDPDEAANDVEQPAAEATVGNPLPSCSTNSGRLTHCNNSQLRHTGFTRQLPLFATDSSASLETDQNGPAKPAPPRVFVVILQHHHVKASSSFEHR